MGPLQKPSASGFCGERTSSGVSLFNTTVLNKDHEACEDVVKLKRAQGECLGIRSRRKS